MCFPDNCNSTKFIRNNVNPIIETSLTLSDFSPWYPNGKCYDWTTTLKINMYDEISTTNIRGKGKNHFFSRGIFNKMNWRAIRTEILLCKSKKPKCNSNCKPVCDGTERRFTLVKEDEYGP